MTTERSPFYVYEGPSMLPQAWPPAGEAPAPVEQNWSSLAENTSPSTKAAETTGEKPRLSITVNTRSRSLRP